MADPTADILARFPGPVTLRAPRFSVRWWFVLLISLFGLATTVSLFLKGRIVGGDLITTWGILAFCGFGTVAAAAALLGGVRLTLDHTGFESVRLFLSRRVRWEDVSAFVAYYPGGNGFVVFDNVRKNTLKGFIDRFLSGRNDYLPDTYGLPAHDLAALMNQWRELALK
jgi:hypothetical protein